MIKTGELPKIDEIRKENFHELTVKILEKYAFNDVANITELADEYSNAYIEVYNFLVKKYYEEFTEEERKAEFEIFS